MEVQRVVRELGPWSTGKGTLQQKLARALMDTIRQGGLGPGVRLPSERDLAQALTVSRTTVVAAYDALREGGWLESRPGSGTRVCNRSPVVAAARDAVQAGALAGSPLLGMLANRDQDVIDFALGIPQPLEELSLDHFTLPPDEYAMLAREHVYYPMGTAVLRQAVAAYYERSGLPTRPEQILVTNGAQHGISLCTALYLRRGDSALVEDPAYFGALDAFRVAGARISSLPVKADGVPPTVLRDRITANAARLVYLTPTLQNPTGAVMPPAARKEVAHISQELGVPVIDDCTLADLSLDATPPQPVAAYSNNAPVITLGTLSKSIGPGFRVGWARAPEPVIERLARLKTANDLSSPLLTQAIGARLLGAMDEVRRLRQVQLKPRRDLLASLLREKLPEWKFRVPAGGLFLWVELPHGDSREYAQTALRHGVVALAGPVMSAAEQQTAFLRLPFLAEPETLRTGVRRLAAAWREYRSEPRERRQGVAII